MSSGIAFRQDNLNVGTYPDPSSSLCKGFGSEINYRVLYLPDTIASVVVGLAPQDY